MAIDDSEHDIGPQPGISRRSFVRRSTLVAGGLLVLGSLPGVADAAPAATVTYAPQALTATEMAALKAVIDRLIPTDALGPGAVDSNVHAYIDRELTAYFKEMLPLYQQNLAGIDAAARKAHGMDFAALTAAQQDALLKQAEAGTLGSGWASFFPLVLEHTREGMFGDPMYGGNTNYAGWDLIHYPGVKLVWSVGEQAIGTTVKPTHTSDATYGGHSFE